jgi:hypothetical protein
MESLTDCIIVHTVRHRVSRHISDERSQNLFWRTWSNPRLSQSISTSVLTALWDRCRGELDLSSFQLVLKASQSPTKTTIVRSIPSDEPSGRSCRRHSPTQNKCQEDAHSMTSNVDISPTSIVTETSQHISNQSTSLHAQHPDVLSPTEELQDGSWSARPRTQRSLSSRSLASRAVTGVRERASTKGRARPSLGRRKSSQGNKLLKSPQPAEPQDLQKESDTLRPLPCMLISSNVIVTNTEAAEGTASTFALPSPSSWEDEPTIVSGRVSPRLPSPGPVEFTIDKDFRGKFAERIASTSNLAGMSRMKKTGSVVRFADEVSVELRKPKEALSTTYEYENRPFLPHRQSASSVAISDGDFDEDQSSVSGLQRTASSLSLLIQSVQLGDGSLPAELSPRKIVKKDKSRKGKDDDEEELLAMGRRGGVTRAGGIQVPPQQRLRDDVDSRYSSPEPDPVF